MASLSHSMSFYCTKKMAKMTEVIPLPTSLREKNNTNYIGIPLARIISDLIQHYIKSQMKFPQ